MTPSNIESSIFTKQRVLRVTVKKKKKRENERRRRIHRWPGFLGSWKVFSSAGECKHCCLLESSLVPASRASSLSLFRHLSSFPSPGCGDPPSTPNSSSLHSPPPVLLRWKGQQASVKESIFGRKKLYTAMWNERICIVSIVINGEGWGCL